MIHQQQDGVVVTTECNHADQVFACCDCLGLFPMRQVGQHGWRVALKLPPGRHHIRYYARHGQATIMHAQEQLEVSEAGTIGQSADRWPEPAEPALAPTAAGPAPTGA